MTIASLDLDLHPPPASEVDEVKTIKDSLQSPDAEEVSLPVFLDWDMHGSPRRNVHFGPSQNQSLLSFSLETSGASVLATEMALSN